MKTLRIAAVLALLAPYAHAWNLAPCDASGAARRTAYGNAVLHAKPGSTHWLPKPFPKRADDAVADFREQYIRLWGRSSTVPPERARLVNALKDHTVQFDVRRVENWRANRCLSAMDGDFFWLLRMTDPSTGEEMARANLHENGMFESIDVAPLGGDRVQLAERIRQHAIPELDAVVHEAAAAGINAENAQYVTAFGTLNCDVMTPCVAFRGGSDVFVQKGAELYRLPANGRHVSWSRELRDQHAKDATMRSLDTQRERLLSLGGDDFAVAEKVR